MPSLPSNYEVVGERFFDEMAELPLKHYHPEAEGAVAASLAAKALVSRHVSFES